MRTFVRVLVIALCVSTEEALVTRPQLETYSVVVKRGEEHFGHAFPEGTRLEVVKRNGHLSNVTLGADHVIDGLLLKKGTSLSLRENGKLWTFYSQPGQTLGGIDFGTASHHVTFDEQGQPQMIHARAPLVVRGYRLIDFIRFHPTGAIAEATSDAEQLHDGLSFKGRSKLTFHPSGGLASAVLLQPHRFGQYEVEAGPVELYADGTLRRALLRTAVTRAPMSFIGPTSFHPSGAPHYVMLAEDTTMDRKSYKKGEVLNLNASGKAIGWKGGATRETDGTFSPPPDWFSSCRTR